jgi:hypothetical protein
MMQIDTEYLVEAIRDSAVEFGITYSVEVIRDGTVIDSEVVHNLVPIEGLNHILGVEFKGVTQVLTWYLGIFEGNYTPTSADTAAAIVAGATECTAYGEATRVALVPGSIAGGAFDNVASKASFTMNATKTIYGCFLTSAPAKSATTGVLTSSVRFGTAKILNATDILQITAGMTATSA